MPSHPDRVRANYRPDIPIDIQRRYAAGEREIAVPATTMEAYANALQVIYRDRPLTTQCALIERMPYKDATVIIIR